MAQGYDACPLHTASAQPVATRGARSAQLSVGIRVPWAAASLPLPTAR